MYLQLLVVVLQFRCNVPFFVQLHRKSFWEFPSQSLGESLVITCENFPRFSQDFDPIWIQTKPRAECFTLRQPELSSLCRHCRPHSVGNHETPRKSHSNPMVLKKWSVINQYNVLHYATWYVKVLDSGLGFFYAHHPFIWMFGKFGPIPK